MKRFYKVVSLYQQDRAFGVHLDGKPVRTPSGKTLLAPTEKLAELLMLEWASQEKDISPASMPLNQIVFTSIDPVNAREKIEEHILSYIDTDLIFYRADNDQYHEKQIEKWDKWISWFENKFTVKLETTSDIRSLKQDKNVFAAVKSYIENLDDLRLTLFHSVIEDTASPVLTTALFERVSTADDLFQAVMIEDLIKAEIYDEERYGAAPDQEKKRKSLRANLEAADKLLSCLEE